MRRFSGAGKNHLNAGYSAASALGGKEEWPDAVLCPSDLMAYGLYKAASERGVRIPDDCIPIGIDGNALNAWIAPWLSSVSVPYSDFGARIVDCLKGVKTGLDVGEVLLEHRLVLKPS